MPSKFPNQGARVRHWPSEVLFIGLCGASSEDMNTGNALTYAPCDVTCAECRELMPDFPKQGYVHLRGRRQYIRK